MQLLRGADFLQYDIFVTYNNNNNNNNNNVPEGLGVFPVP